LQVPGFKAATRGDIDGNTTLAGQPLSTADITSLAIYIAGLRPP
jgi:hypothetical protein